MHVMFAANIAAPALTLLLPVFFLFSRLKHKKRNIAALTGSMLAADLLLIVSAASVPVLQQKYFLALGGGSVNLYAMFILGEIVFAVCAFMYLTGSFVAAIKEKTANGRIGKKTCFSWDRY